MYRPPRLISPLLLPPSLVFGAAIGLRNQLYSSGLCRQQRLIRPVISIGNITLGGAGKTPLAIYLAGLLARMSAIPALLSRGYGRKNPSQVHLLAPMARTPAGPPDLGDEPALIRRYRPEIWLGISSNRFEAGNEILRKQPRAIFILDDGFQHRQLGRDLDVVIIDPMQPLRRNHLFPAGSLREPLSSLRRAHVIVLNGARTDKCTQSAASIVREVAPRARLFYCAQRIASFAPYHQWKQGSSAGTQSLRGRPAFLVSAIGSPKRFERDVAEMGVMIKGSIFYRDHYRLRAADWFASTAEARRSAAEVIIVTEKDAIKITHVPEIALFVAVQAVEMAEAEELELMIRPILEVGV
jgi:tetraacyldisaccharide 4'-kinase